MGQNSSILPVLPITKELRTNAHKGAAHELFLLPDAEFLNRFVSGIAEQGKIEFVLFLERSKRFDRIGAHAEDGHTVLVELLFCVTKLGRFNGSTRVLALGRKEEDALAGEVFQRDFVAFVGFEAKGGALAPTLSIKQSFAIDLRSLPG